MAAAAALVDEMQGRYSLHPVVGQQRGVGISPGEQENVMACREIGKHSEGTGGMAATVTEHPVGDSQEASVPSHSVSRLIRRPRYSAATKWDRCGRSGTESLHGEGVLAEVHATAVVSQDDPQVHQATGVPGAP